MKKIHIFLLIVIAASVAIIISATGDASQYVSFGEAAKMLKDGDDQKVHVVGTLPKSASGDIIGIEYEPLKDANFIAFDLIDTQNKRQRVVCYNPPASIQDLKKSEQVVIIGKMNAKGEFVASEILMKCPSKYEEKEIKS